MKTAFLLLTKIMFNKSIKINRPTTIDVSVFIYLFFRFTFFFPRFFLLLPDFRLLPGFFRVEEFPRKRKRDKNYLPWTSKGWKGKFRSEFSTKILYRFGAYFKLHQPNPAGLDIVGKVLLCFTIWE